MRGWITELRKDAEIVYLIAHIPSGSTLAYTVTFHGSERPAVNDHRGQPLPPNIAVRYKARQTAVVALQGKFFYANYNFEVLDDPDGSGFLVYALAATNKTGEQITGGHYRVTVSAGGRKVSPHRHRADGQRHPGRDVIYSSNLYHLPIFVDTPDKAVWQVANGRIEKLEKKLVDRAAAESKRKKN